MGERTYFRTAGNTDEQAVYTGRCRLHAVVPDLTTTGTVTLKDDDTGGTAFSVSAIGLTQAGKQFHGMVMPKGLSITLSAATDLCVVIFEPF